jgi:hypothetical protein
VAATAHRLGGNRTSGYNWENNLSSAGEDWHNYNDGYLFPKDRDSSIPGITIIDFVEKAKANGAYALVTLPMAGYVANDSRGTVKEEDTAPSHRFAQIIDRKNRPLSLVPDLSDGVVYSDEMVNYLVSKLGSSRNGGINAYSLDNEPSIWPGTHPRIHPGKTTVAEILEKSVSLASVVKDIDPYAEVFGPALYGVGAYANFQGAPDWNQYSSNYKWFLEAYLDGMRRAGEEKGQRLLDVLDLHYYTEARSSLDHRVSFDQDTNEQCIYARFQSTRSLWDRTYRETSWITQALGRFLPILPNVVTSIEQYYPGTKLAFSEYNFGAENSISGGIAQADALGIFATYGVYFATLWPGADKIEYIYAGINLYTNYDSNGAAFGNMLVESKTNNVEYSSVFASIGENDELHIVLLNKSQKNPERFVFDIQSSTHYRTCAWYGFDADSSKIRKFGSGVFDENGTDNFALEVPPLTAIHLVLMLN